MATLLKVDRVQYLCNCGVWEPLCKLYFCRHCTVLRCAECVNHEIDSNYCPNCLENMPSAEARLKRNRCGNCMECPSCSCALAVRATSLLPPGVAPPSGADDSGSEKPSASLAPKKAYYLACNACHWTSRDSAIPDQTSATGNWPQHKNPYDNTLNSVLDYFKQLAAFEKADMERKKFTKRRSHMGMFYTDKYGMQALYARKRLGGGAIEKPETMYIPDDGTPTATDEVPELSDNFFLEELDLQKVSLIEQRHKQPLSQSAQLTELYPSNKRLMIRRSLRCKQCDHNLCKGEFNPSSIKFKIQMFAILHVPEIRIMEQPKLKAGEKCELRLSLSNLTAALMHIVLLPNANLIDDKQFGQVEIPVIELTLPHRDETAELDETSDQQQAQFKDDPNVVIYRKRHKMGIKLTVIPNKVEGEIWISFILKYDYVNTTYVSSGEASEPEIIWLQQTLKINLGCLPNTDT